jgi:protein phosphatase
MKVKLNMFGLWKKSKKAKGEEAADETGSSEAVAESADHEPANYEVAASVLSDVGCVRELNEDSAAYVQPYDEAVLAGKGMLFVVADGMGGHSAGEVASNMAVEVIRRVYYEEDREAQAALKKAVEKANREIFEAAARDETMKGMGTTCTALVLQNGRAISAHVGDSRMYLVRDGQIYLLTEDHSAVMEMVKHGIISAEEARHHPDKNVILRALGSHAEVEVSTWQEPLPVREGDRFVLCSDGLYDLVEDEEIRQAVSAAEPRAACESLVALAKQRGGHDNITVAIVSLKPVAEAQPRAVPETREVEVVQ